MRNKISLLGLKEVNAFLEIVKNLSGTIEITNPINGHRVDARSTLGLLLAASEWGGNTWVESEFDIYDQIEDFIVVADNDAANIHN